ncbi:VOC family protein [Nocardia sp. NPDC051570]|uniref:VOC family protein n=1 Tax=Nocardia sp. NPDC051570 TaxID=3364324 RepID=UPI0037A37827
MAHYYHVCFVVPDLEVTMRDLTAAAGLSWGRVVEAEVEGAVVRVVYSDGPAHAELVQAPSGGSWGDTSRARFHHIGFWTSDLAAGADRLTACGFPEVAPFGRAAEGPWAYFAVDSIGGHVELVDAAMRGTDAVSWIPDVPAAEVIDEHVHSCS